MQTSEGKIIRAAEFNTALKLYILLYGAFMLAITVVGIPLALIWLCGPGQWYANHYFNKLECVITDTNLRFKKGILVQFEKTIPLENIQDISFIEGPVLRYFHLAVLRVETAGGSANNMGAMSLVGIVDAQAFRLMVMAQRNLLKQAQSGQRSDSADGNTLLEIKEILLRIESLMKQKG